jgi:hypothetical protein
MCVPEQMNRWFVLSVTNWAICRIIHINAYIMYLPRTGRPEMTRTPPCRRCPSRVDIIIVAPTTFGGVASAAPQGSLCTTGEPLHPRLGRFSHIFLGPFFAPSCGELLDAFIGHIAYRCHPSTHFPPLGTAIMMT